jgi:hypothetical protein
LPTTPSSKDYISTDISFDLSYCSLRWTIPLPYVCERISVPGIFTGTIHYLPCCELRWFFNSSIFCVLKMQVEEKQEKLFAVECTSSEMIKVAKIFYFNTWSTGTVPYGRYLYWYMLPICMSNASRIPYLSLQIDRY